MPLPFIIDRAEQGKCIIHQAIGAIVQHQAIVAQVQSGSPATSINSPTSPPGIIIMGVDEDDRVGVIIRDYPSQSGLELPGCWCTSTVILWQRTVKDRSLVSCTVMVWVWTVELSQSSVAVHVRASE